MAKLMGIGRPVTANTGVAGHAGSVLDDLSALPLASGLMTTDSFTWTVTLGRFPVGSATRCSLR